MKKLCSDIMDENARCKNFFHTRKCSKIINNDGNFKSFHVQMVDENTSSHYSPYSFDIEQDCIFERLNQSELMTNRCGMANFLDQSDSEDFDVCSSGAGMSCSRSTQTCMSDWTKKSSILRTCDFNHPATISSSTSRQISTPSLQANNHELMLAKTQLYNVHRNYETLKLRFHKLHTDYWKLMGITTELILVLENSARGEAADIQEILRVCMEKYPDIFHQNISDYSKIKSESDIYKTNLQRSMLSTIPLSPKLLDFKKIKLHLVCGNIKTRLLLLQALRWKITLSQPGERDEALHEYINNDLLGLHGQMASDYEKPILPYLLIPLDVVVPHPMQQSAARLLNTFASLKCGRDYLAIGPSVLNVVVQCLDSTVESIDAFTCDMILATLQKLSLRKQQRLYMIAAGVVEWLIHHLKAECHSMGTYRLEYATALLMNLSLQKEAQIRAAVMAPIVISTLIVLLSLDHLAALPYVNGALNNFLANSDINEEAKIIRLGSILEYHRNNRTGELRNHLDHILMRHNRKNNKSLEEDVIEDDDREELDNLDDELDEMDPVKIHAGDLVGETLLSTCYSIKPHVVQVVNKTPNWSLANVQNESLNEDNPADANKKYCNDCILPLHSQTKREPGVTEADLAMTRFNPITTSAFEDKEIVEQTTSKSFASEVESLPNIERPSIPKEDADAFLAKPKLPRTPPHSELTEVHHEKKSINSQ